MASPAEGAGKRKWPAKEAKVVEKMRNTYGRFGGGGGKNCGLGVKKSQCGKARRIRRGSEQLHGEGMSVSVRRRRRVQAGGNGHVLCIVEDRQLTIYQNIEVPDQVIQIDPATALLGAQHTAALVVGVG